MLDGIIFFINIQGAGIVIEIHCLRYFTGDSQWRAIMGDTYWGLFARKWGYTEDTIGLGKSMNVATLPEVNGGRFSSFTCISM